MLEREKRRWILVTSPSSTAFHIFWMESRRFDVIKGHRNAFAIAVSGNNGD
jgi:hypothetical protein